MAFLDENYLLSNPTAVSFYREVAELPILDPHNHADVKAVADNQPFTDLWQAEAATDHYVWEMLRKCGVPENLLTGKTTTNEAKWLALAANFEALVGAPTYEWVHLDLKRRLGLQDNLSAATGKKIWDDGLKVLARPEMRPQALLQGMRVQAMCSTDDPIDTLEHHRRLDSSPIKGVIRPTFRPDKAMNIFKKDWADYILKVEACVGGRFRTLKDLRAALQQRHDYFAANGCIASDHGVETPYGHDVTYEEANAVFRKARKHGKLTPAEVIAYMSWCLQEFAEMDAAKDWVFQLHLGAVRDVRDVLLRDLGPDTGGDISDHRVDIVKPVRDLLNRTDARLKVVLYCLEPGHQATLATLTRAFGAKVNLGSAWWMNDSPIGMKRQLEYIGTVDVLSTMAGMVSDSRKLLSYGSRHEMFRRVLCDVVGSLVERGQAPAPAASRLVQRLCYQRPKELFGL